MSDRDLERGPWRRARLWPTLRLLAFALLAAAAIFSSARTFQIAKENRTTLHQVQVNQKRIDEEGIERRDQICLSAEREHKRDVDQLKATYAYLDSLTDAEARMPLNQTILRGLAQTEDKAHTDVAPNFCDEPGVKQEALYKKTKGKQGKPPVGLPEPDPVIPSRTARVDQLWLQANKAN